MSLFRYNCTDANDGLAILGPDGVTMEGSDTKEIRWRQST